MSSAAAPGEGSRKVHLQSRTVITTGVTSGIVHHVEAFRSLYDESPRSKDENFPWILHLKCPVTPRVRQLLSGHLEPFSLGAYLPHNTFLVAGPGPHHRNLTSFTRLLESAPYVAHVEPLQPRDRVSPRLPAPVRLRDLPSHLPSQPRSSNDDSVEDAEESLTYLLVTVDSASLMRTAMDQQLSGGSKAGLPSLEQELVARWQRTLVRWTGTECC